jgi:hypothetical protein
MSDEELERQIDEAGRNAVFARASAHGWKNVPPPKWVWYQIVAEVRAEAQTPASPAQPQYHTAQTKAWE